MGSTTGGIFTLNYSKLSNDFKEILNLTIHVLLQKAQTRAAPQIPAMMEEVLRVDQLAAVAPSQVVEEEAAAEADHPEVEGLPAARRAAVDLLVVDTEATMEVTTTAITVIPLSG